MVTFFIWTGIVGYTAALVAAENGRYVALIEDSHSAGAAKPLGSPSGLASKAYRAAAITLRYDSTDRTNEETAKIIQNRAVEIASNFGDHRQQMLQASDSDLTPIIL